MVYDIQFLKAFFTQAQQVFSLNRQMLIELDGIIGDGDLGITMEKAFSSALKSAQEFSGNDLGECCIDCGKAIAFAAPSTMGTLMATGFMYGGKEIRGQEILDTASLALFLDGFQKGLIKRGKANPGEKTILDIVGPLADSAKEILPGTPLSEAVEAMKTVAKASLEKTKDMVAQHGKAAIYREKTLGKQDPGATAFYLLAEAFYHTVLG
jgi:dihydroxyacetone kinase-like protein